MNLIKELRDVVQAIREAIRDKKITFDEAIAILGEVLDVIALLIPYARVKYKHADDEQQQ
jgi:hypothetical protein